MLPLQLTLSHPDGKLLVLRRQLRKARDGRDVDGAERVAGLARPAAQVHEVVLDVRVFPQSELVQLQNVFADLALGAACRGVLQHVIAGKIRRHRFDF